MSQTHRQSYAALAALVILQGIMLGSLYAGVAPHPPATIPLFGMGPFLGAAIAAAIAAMILGPLDSRAGRLLAGLAALAALASFGPQKYLDAQFPLIWPAVISAQIAAIAVFGALVTSRQRRATA
ncbi:hypothetical protein [Pararhodobacter marinus]|uniref:Uncharacterized protein n=1 Tax=Pararhodobacter marinus TaxID=2184063 RepID=A0A2U2CCS1_9RHOB|nr:hypothetical protein [Pararhodobacter marinus]PWE29594.1 hypothetical protein C4N9_07555 [Pararhodobacter marinus]